MFEQRIKLLHFVEWDRYYHLKPLHEVVGQVLRRVSATAFHRLEAFAVDLTPMTGSDLLVSGFPRRCGTCQHLCDATSQNIVRMALATWTS